MVCDIHNVSELRPCLQTLHDGGVIRMHRLVELPGGRTRLLERGRHASGHGLLAKLGFGLYLVDPIGFVMSRKMPRTVERLAGAHPEARPVSGPATDLPGGGA